MSKTWLIVLASFIAAGVILGILFISFTGSPKDTGKDTVTAISQDLIPTEVPTTMPSPSTTTSPSMTLIPQTEYSAILTTTAGKITLLLNAQETPVTVNNFVVLSRKGFYNNTFFHRVIKNFMIQGGDPKGDGTGGPGYSFSDEPFTGDYVRGTLAMANAGPNTNGSQFFIMHRDASLPRNYVIFGHVTAGLDVLDKIAEASVSANLSGEYSKPVSPVTITSVQILEKKLSSSKLVPSPTGIATPSATPVSY